MPVSVRRPSACYSIRMNAASETVLHSANRVPLFGWIFMTIFLLFCAGFTYLLVRDGTAHFQISPSSPALYPPWALPAVAALFWLVGLAVANRLFRTPCVTVTVDRAGTTTLRRRYPFSAEVMTLTPEMIVSAVLAEETDSEGDPYYRVDVTTTQGDTFVIKEGSDRDGCEEARTRFLQALHRAP